MSRRPFNDAQRSAAAWGLLVCAVASSSCSTPRTRPVLDVVPVVTRVEITTDASVDALAFSLEDEAEPATPDSALDVAFEDVVARTTGARTSTGGPDFERLFGDKGPTQLDPDLGPVDLGLAVQVNLGAGEAPYDDAVAPIHAVVPGRSGFSDSVLQFSYRERLGRTYGLHGTAALTRFQDVAIIDGISDAEFAWFVLGVHASF